MVNLPYNQSQKNYVEIKENSTSGGDAVAGRVGFGDSGSFFSRRLRITSDISHWKQPLWKYSLLDRFSYNSISFSHSSHSY